MPEKKVTYEELLGIKKPTGENMDKGDSVGELNPSVALRASVPIPVVLKPPPEIIIPTELGINFNRIANLSTFQRFIIEAIKISVPGFEGVPSRGKKEVMAIKFNQRIADYRDVMKELKEKFKERNERE